MYVHPKSGLGRNALSCFLLVCLFSTAAPLSGADWVYPLSLAARDSDTVYLADRNLPGIWQLQGAQLSLVFQGSKQFRTPLNAVRCVALDRDGKLLAGDSATRDVYRFDEAGKPQALTAQDKEYGQIGIPMDIVSDSDGNLIVSDLEIHRIVRVPKNGGNVEEIATMTAPRGLFYDAKNLLWVIANRKLVRLSAEGKKETIVDEGVFQYPHTVVVSPDGVAYVCDGYAKAIWKVEPGKKPVKLVSGDPLVNPVGMDLVGDKILVVDPRAKAVFEIDKQGKISRREAKPAE